MTKASPTNPLLEDVVGPVVWGSTFPCLLGARDLRGQLDTRQTLSSSRSMTSESRSMTSPRAKANAAKRFSGGAGLCGSSTVDLQRARSLVWCACARVSPVLPTFPPPSLPGKAFHTWKLSFASPGSLPLQNQLQSLHNKVRLKVCLLHGVCHRSRCTRLLRVIALHRFLSKLILPTMLDNIFFESKP